MITVRSNIVAVVPIFDPDMSASGLLYIPDQAKERCDQGIVKYVGKKVHETIDVEYGDHVIFSGYDGTLSRETHEGLLIYLPADKIVAKLYPPEREDTWLRGLYFRDKLTPEQGISQIEQIMEITGCNQSRAEALFDTGFKKNEYLYCNYSMVVELLAESISNAPWKNKYKFVDKKATSPDKGNVFK